MELKRCPSEVITACGIEHGPIRFGRIVGHSTIRLDKKSPPQGRRNSTNITVDPTPFAKTRASAPGSPYENAGLNVITTQKKRPWFAQTAS